MNDRGFRAVWGLILWMGTLAWAGWALEVDVLEIELSVAPGQLHPFKFLVRNETAVAELFTLSVGDWDRDETGNNRFYPPGTLDRSLAPWIELSSASFRLGPGEAREVAGLLRVPVAGVGAGTYWGVVFVQGEPRPTLYQGSVVMVTKRIGIKLYAHVGAPQPMGVIRAVEPRGLSPLWVALRFHNTGAYNLRDVRAEGQVFDATGQVVAEMKPASFPCLPGGERVIALETDFRPAVGTYLVAVKVELPGGAILVGQIQLRIRPLALVPLAGGLLPQDLDGDGLYEDINGDGVLDEADVALFAVQFSSPAVQANWRAFDFTNDGRVDAQDVQALEQRLTRSRLPGGS